MLTFYRKSLSFLRFDGASLSSDQNGYAFKRVKNTNSLLRHASEKWMNAFDKAHFHGFGMIKNDLILLTYVRFLKKYFIKRYKALENERTYL